MAVQPESKATRALPAGTGPPAPRPGRRFRPYFGEPSTAVSHATEALIAPAVRGLDVWDTALIQRRMDEVAPRTSLRHGRARHSALGVDETPAQGSLVIDCSGGVRESRSDS